MTITQEIEQVHARFYAAVHLLQQGDPRPMVALWSHRADTLNLGPQGGRQHGWEDIRAYFADAARQAAASPQAVSATVSDVGIHAAAGFAYVSGTEEVRITGGDVVRRFTARATHIYRREADDWKLVYRHADAPPVERHPSDRPEQPQFSA